MFDVVEFFDKNKRYIIDVVIDRLVIWDDI